MNPIQNFDDRLFIAINGQVGHWPWLDALARLFLNDYFVPTVMALILVGLWFEGKTPATQLTNRQAVLVGALSAALANILLKAINLMYHRPRPFDTLEVNLLFYQPHDPSLPSNAAALGFSIATGVWFYQRRWGSVLLGIAALFALSRVFGGVHYPLDVISGALLGITSAWIIRRQTSLVNLLLRLTVNLAKKLKIQPETPLTINNEQLSMNNE